MHIYKKNCVQNDRKLIFKRGPLSFRVKLQCILLTLFLNVSLYSLLILFLLVNIFSKSVHITTFNQIKVMFNCNMSHYFTLHKEKHYSILIIGCH